MYCPKCSQQQSSDQMRFCSRCGLNFGQVANLIARDSASSFEHEETLTKRLVAMALYIIVAILAVTGWGPWSGPEGERMRTFAILLSVLTFVLLFSRPLRQIIHTLLPRCSKQADSSQLMEEWDSARAEPALAPAQSIPVRGLNPQGLNTAEMVSPHSVTEHTTTLLDKK